MGRRRNTSRTEDTAWRKIITGRGLRVTGPRLALLREMKRARGPVTHAELFARLEPLGIDRVTLYRNLQALTDAGILVRTEVGDRTWRYELLDQSGATHGEHAHFVCTSCGGVQCLPDGSVALRTPSLRKQSVEVQVRGRCEGCLEV